MNNSNRQEYPSSSSSSLSIGITPSAKRVDVMDYLHFEQSNERIASRNMKGAQDILENLKNHVHQQELVLIDEGSKSNDLRKKILNVTANGVACTVDGKPSPPVSLTSVSQTLGLVNNKAELVTAIQSDVQSRIDKIEAASSNMEQDSSNQMDLLEKLYAKAKQLTDALDLKQQNFEERKKHLTQLTLANEKKREEILLIEQKIQSAKESLEEMKTKEDKTKENISSYEKETEEIESELASSKESIEKSKLKLDELTKNEKDLSMQIEECEAELSGLNSKYEEYSNEQTGVPFIQAEIIRNEKERMATERFIANECIAPTRVMARNVIQIGNEITFLENRIAQFQNTKIDAVLIERQKIEQELEKKQSKRKTIEMSTAELRSKTKNFRDARLAQSVIAGIDVNAFTLDQIFEQKRDLEKQIQDMKQKIASYEKFEARKKQLTTKHSSRMMELATAFQSKVAVICNPIQEEIDKMRLQIQQMDSTFTLQ